MLYNGVSSGKLPVTHGTPEGSIVAPVLFLVYINDLLTSLSESDTLAYADDLTLIACDGNVNMAALKLQFLLDVAHVWSLRNRLYLNAAKCIFIILPTSRRKNSTQPSIFLRIGTSHVQ